MKFLPKNFFYFILLCLVLFWFIFTIYNIREPLNNIVTCSKMNQEKCLSNIGYCDWDVRLAQCSNKHTCYNINNQQNCNQQNYCSWDNSSNVCNSK